MMIYFEMTMTMTMTMTLTMMMMYRSSARKACRRHCVSCHTADRPRLKLLYLSYLYYNFCQHYIFTIPRRLDGPPLLSGGPLAARQQAAPGGTCHRWLLPCLGRPGAGHTLAEGVPARCGAQRRVRPDCSVMPGNRNVSFRFSRPPVRP